MDKLTKTIYETATYYKIKNISVHITFKSGDWVNGIITSINEDFKDRLILFAEKYGEMLIFFDRIKDDGIVPRIPSEEEKEDEKGFL